MYDKYGKIEFKLVDGKKIIPLKLTIYKIRVKCVSNVFEDNLNNY